MENAPASAPPRLASLDAYRGFIMLLMVSGGFGIPELARNLPDSAWATVAPWFEHVPWAGGVLWDMIQPAFMFMVGVAAAFSVQKRRDRGDSWWRIFLHAAIRSIVLILLAVLLASNGGKSKQTVWLFTNVLGQIGLGYFFLILFAKGGASLRVLAAIILVMGYWIAFLRWPVGAPPDPATLTWMKPDDLFTGFFAHWNPHTNIAAEFDRWFLNLFPRSERFEFANGGYQTLNFVPSLATMLLGLVAGECLRKDGNGGKKLGWLVGAGVLLVAIGFAAHFYSVCPIVKRIWTPAWVLWSGGIVILMLAAFYAVIDLAGWKAWSYPFMIIGANSIFVYLASQLSRPWIKDTLTRHFGADLYSGPYAPMIERCSILLVLWLICWWLWRSKAFIRI